jgi:hypothetical protein
LNSFCKNALMATVVTTKRSDIDDISIGDATQWKHDSNAIRYPLVKGVNHENFECIKPSDKLATEMKTEDALMIESVFAIPMAQVARKPTSIADSTNTTWNIHWSSLKTHLKMLSDQSNMPMKWNK